MSEFVKHLHEVFESLGAINTRKMFGGYGVYYDGVMFALVADDVLYLKTDQELAKVYEARNLGAFEYVKNGKSMKMSYHLAPDDIYESPETAEQWARRSYEIALRAKRIATKKRVSKKQHITNS